MAVALSSVLVQTSLVRYLGYVHCMALGEVDLSRKVLCPCHAVVHDFFFFFFVDMQSISFLGNVWLFRQNLNFFQLR